VADVLIVCVREDEPQAKALAEMFEAAGFSIGGAPSSDAALRSSGAGLVVWSQASIRSRPFLDAAQRVINAEKAIVASLIEPPPPSSIGDSPVFDLSRWDGDTDDPSLDPLFFAVDRMVNAARTSVGAAEADEAYTPAPRQRAAPPPPPAPQPSYSRPTPQPAPPNDPLGTEAEHWRAIRDSRDPTDFMDYLARYGPTGAFAEVAELRLKQLTARSEARPTPLPPPPPRPAPAPRPMPRMEQAPARRAEPPSPPRRVEPPPPRRADPPRRFERSYERADLREPPRESSNAMRTFILIALLGGGALAGGLYFGGGIPSFVSAPAAEADVAATPPPAFDESGEPASAEEIAGVPLADATAPTQPRRTEIAARTETARPAPAPAQEEAPPPAPVTSWTNNNGQGGPVSLRPGESAPSTTAAVNTPPVQVASTAQPISEPATTRATPSAPRGTVTWAQRPSSRRISELYPSRAMRAGVGGRVELSCNVRANQTLSCSVANESPAGLGFGQAALSASSSYRASPTLSDGSASNGAPARIVVQFQAPSE
jgi:outer membrane biosynthesis protein TonB